VLSGDFLITPAGTFQLKGQTLQKVSSKVRLPLLGSISPGPTFISDNYRLVFTDKVGLRKFKMQWLKSEWSIDVGSWWSELLVGRDF